MKVIIFDSGNLSAEGNTSMWYLVADSAISNTGKPFYLPENHGIVTVRVGIALKFSRLGKFIEPRYAGRYFRTYAPSVHFTLTALKDELKDKGMPFSAAVSFDRSVMAGDWDEFPSDPQHLTVSLRLNGEVKAVWDYKDLSETPEILIGRFSKMNTVKMGDILIPPMSRETEIRIGDCLEVIHNDKPAYTIKVK